MEWFEIAVNIVASLAAGGFFGWLVARKKAPAEIRKTDADAVREITEAAARISDVAEKAVDREINRRFQSDIDWAARVEKLEDMVQLLQDKSDNDGAEITRLQSELIKAVEQTAAQGARINDQENEIRELRDRLRVTTQSLDKTIEELYLAKQEISTLRGENAKLKTRLGKYERKTGAGNECD